MKLVSTILFNAVIPIINIWDISGEQSHSISQNMMKCTRDKSEKNGPLCYTYSTTDSFAFAMILVTQQIISNNNKNNNKVSNVNATWSGTPFSKIKNL